jgi:hypothetical protein
MHNQVINSINLRTVFEKLRVFETRDRRGKVRSRPSDLDWREIVRILYSRKKDTLNQ